MPYRFDPYSRETSQVAVDSDERARAALAHTTRREVNYYNYTANSSLSSMMPPVHHRFGPFFGHYHRYHSSSSNSATVSQSATNTFCGSFSSVRVQFAARRECPHEYAAVVERGFNKKWHAFCEEVCKLHTFLYTADDYAANPQLALIAPRNELRLAAAPKGRAMADDLKAAAMFPAFKAAAAERIRATVAEEMRAFNEAQPAAATAATGGGSFYCCLGAAEGVRKRPRTRRGWAEYVEEHYAAAVLPKSFPVTLSKQQLRAVIFDALAPFSFTRQQQQQQQPEVGEEVGTTPAELMPVVISGNEHKALCQSAGGDGGRRDGGGSRSSSTASTSTVAATAAPSRCCWASDSNDKKNNKNQRQHQQCPTPYSGNNHGLHGVQLMG